MGRKSENIFKQEDQENHKDGHVQPLLKDVANQYLDNLRTTHRRATVTKYEGQYRKYIIPEFGDKHVDEINTHDIISFVHSLLAGNKHAAGDGSNGNNRSNRNHRNHGHDRHAIRGRNNKALSPKTIHEINALMGRIRRFSILHGYEIRYATDCIELPTKAKKISILTKKDEEKLLSYLKDNFNLTSMGILLSLFSGIRLGELCALKWNDFSLEERYFHVCRTMQRLPNNVDKKASSKTVVAVEEFEKPSLIRTIPIPEKLMDYLLPLYVEDAYILSGHKERFVEPRTMENRFKAVLEKCGIEYVNFNTLRHTFATRCVEVGFDVKALSEILGHSNVNMTLNRYVYPSMQTKHKNMNKLNGLL